MDMKAILPKQAIKTFTDSLKWNPDTFKVYIAVNSIYWSDTIMVILELKDFQWWDMMTAIQ